MKNKKPTTETDNRTKRKKTILIVALAIALIILTLLFLTIGQGRNVASETSTATPNVLNDNREGIDGTYQSMSREEILEDLENNQQIVTDTVSSNVTFPSRNTGTIGEWVLENIEDNSVIQQAEIYFNNLLIAKTEPVYPGQYIQAVELLENLEPGEYEAIAYISYYNEDDKTFAGKAGYKIHLTVEE